MDTRPDLERARGVYVLAWLRERRAPPAEHGRPAVGVECQQQQVKPGHVHRSAEGRDVVGQRPLGLAAFQLPCQVRGLGQRLPQMGQARIQVGGNWRARGDGGTGLHGLCRITTDVG